jgi:hypothetical protein
MARLAFRADPVADAQARVDVSRSDRLDRKNEYVPLVRISRDIKRSIIVSIDYN